jgi:hypothetical protein
MGKVGWILLAGGVALVCWHSAMADDGSLRCIQKPIAWMVGQQTRIVVETPADCPELQVTAPPEVELFDRWPWQQGDTTQKLYFRAKAPLAAGSIEFKAHGHSLAIPIQVLTWAQAREPRKFEQWDLPRIFPMDGQDEPKQGITFLSEELLAELRVQGLPNADEVAADLPADDDLYYSLPETTIPRVVFVQYQQPKGCPICGRKIFEGRSPFYPWELDFENHPWKVGCPECGRWFPSNDFAAGDMDSGEFPDDGWGCFREGETHPYAFIGYYTCWHYLRRWVPLVTNLSNQYALSGDRRIGHSAALALFRTAEQYMNLAVNINQRKSLMRSSVWEGGIIPQTNVPIYNTWLYVEHNWEVPRFTQYAEAFEKLWGFFDEEDPDLLAFVQTHGHPDVRTMQDFREFIETGYFRTVAQACLDKNLIGNLPQGQRATIESALFLNSPRSFELVDWVLNGGGMMRYFLTNDYFIDGSGFESQGYNAGHVYNLEEFARVMERIRELDPDRYNGDRFPTLTDDPKYKNLFDFCINFNLIGRTNAQTGDAGDVAGTGPSSPFQTTDVAATWFAGPFALTRDPRFAMVLWDTQAKAPIADVKDPELRREIEQIVAERGWDIHMPSNVCDGYGHAILRTGEGDDRRALWVRYGRHRGHAHDDMLTIGWEGKMRKLLPELGYPHSWTFRGPWEGNWATHYCARIVGAPDHRSRGHCKLFADGPWARVATAYSPAHRDVDAPQVYEMLPDWVMERTIALIDLNEADSYALGVFRLSGGTDHYWSFHGPRTEGQATVEGLDLQAQEGGTLAGPDIPYGQGGEWSKQNANLTAFPYLYDVSRATTDGTWSVDWPLEGHPDIHVRMTPLPFSDFEVNLAKGKPPGGGDPYELAWAIARTSGAEPHHTQLADVIEVYSGERLISDITRLAVQTDAADALPPAAVEVSAGNRIDTVICSREPTPATAKGVSTNGCFAIWSETGGELTGAYLVGGSSLMKGGLGVKAAAGEWRGRIASVDYANRKVVVDPPPSDPSALVGRYARMTNECSDCMHLITAVGIVGDSCQLTLELDPRICEGPVTDVQANAITSGVTLQLAGLRYCHGKTLTNEDGSAMYRVSGVTGRQTVWIDPAHHGEVATETLKEQFGDRDGDGISRFLVYDYGVGDEVCVPTVVSVRRESPTRWLLETTVAVNLKLPGIELEAVKPGEERMIGPVSIRPSGPGRLDIEITG